MRPSGRAEVGDRSSPNCHPESTARRPERKRGVCEGSQTQGSRPPHVIRDPSALLGTLRGFLGRAIPALGMTGVSFSASRHSFEDPSALLGVPSRPRSPLGAKSSLRSGLHRLTTERPTNPCKALRPSRTDPRPIHQPRNQKEARRFRPCPLHGRQSTHL